MNGNLHSFISLLISVYSNFSIQILDEFSCMHVSSAYLLLVWQSSLSVLSICHSVYLSFQKMYDFVTV